MFYEKLSVILNFYVNNFLQASKVLSSTSGWTSFPKTVEGNVEEKEEKIMEFIFI